MKNKSIYITMLLVLVMTLSILLVGCEYEGHKADSISFQLQDKSTVDHMELEEKTASKMTLVENGVTSFDIVYKGEKTFAINMALDILKDTIHEMTGATMEIVNSARGNSAIYVGDAYELDITKVNNDGFAISIDDDRIAIRGREDIGTRNGVYYFVENYLGALFLSSSETYIPHHDSIYLTRGEYLHNPATPWRDVTATEVADDFWAAKLKLNSIDVERSDEEVLADLKASGRYHEGLTDRMNIFARGRQHIDWYGWSHNIYDYVSPDEYFETHPEYFSMRGGKRIKWYKYNDAQLCLSNEEVYRIVEDKMMKIIAENPDKKYFDFSCNDNYFVKGCQCKQCKALDKAAGGTGMGSLLPFINRLAKKARETFPDREVYISTLAYFHTLKPPTNIKAEPNVVIKICTMPGDQGTSYLNPGNGKAYEFHKMLSDWHKVCDKFIVWDYTVNFTHLLTPFPNFAVQADNQKFYEENGIQGVFHQGSREIGGESAIMRSYILSKLMWEGSSMDVGHEVSKYITAYYGNAASDVINYYNAIHSNLAKSSSTLGLYDENMAHFFGGYLSKSNIEKYAKMIENGKMKVDKDSKYMHRLEDLELNITYAKMTLPTISSKERAALSARFNELCEERNIDHVGELLMLDDFNDKLGGKVFVYGLVAYSPLIIVGVIAIIVGIILLIVHHKKRKKKAVVVHKE